MTDGPHEQEAWDNLILGGRKFAEDVLKARNKLNLARRAEGWKPRGILMAEGDSWFDYPGVDILAELQDAHSWDVRSVAHRGDRLESMAYERSQLEQLCRKLESIKGWGHTPSALLLSGGGDDIAGPQFEMLLEHKLSPRPGLNESITQDVIHRRLHDALVFLISVVNVLCDKTFGHKIPIIIHGYDYPVPDGRGFLTGFGLLPGPWLSPSFKQKGFVDDELEERKNIAAKIIDDYNEMLSGLAAQSDLSNVVYLDLRGTLSTDAKDYRDWWANEMHPTQKGFAAVADKFATAIDNCLEETPGQQ